MECQDISFVKPEELSVVPTYVQIQVKTVLPLKHSDSIVFYADFTKFAQGGSTFAAWNAVHASDGFHVLSAEVISGGVVVAWTMIIVFLRKKTVENVAYFDVTTDNPIKQ